MKHINGKQLADAFLSATNAMLNNVERINGMNVFPVPDGDTGSNMGATIDYANSEIKQIKDKSNIYNIASKFARGMLMGARGNSGVILSQIFKGFSEALKGKETATQFDIVESFKLAKEYAYKSVMKPVEGTILTVIRLTHEELQKTITPSNSVEDVFVSALKFAKEACIKTPEFLPVLKEVGVTDSGGEGLMVIIEGIVKYLKGTPVKIDDKFSNYNTGKSEFLFESEDFDGEFGYCTEFIIQLDPESNFKKEKFEQTLAKHGNSAVVVHDDDIVKVHIHTLKPGNVFNLGQKYGEFLRLKSENMTIQANETQSKSLQGKNSSKKADKKKKNIAVISCNSGDGIISEMKEMGADFIIEGGQTSNPSASDFFKAIKELNSENIIILPNNSNIVLVAQQVAQTSKKKVIVIPTKTQVEGLSAIINFDRDSALKINQESMNEAIEEVKTGQVTKAGRTTKINGTSVVAGEYLAIAERKIIKSVNSKIKAAKEICKKLIDEDVEVVSIYYGQDSTETDASELESYIETNFDVQIEIKNGKQPVYDFLISFE